MRINFGCGRQVLPGYFNVDAVRSPKAPRDPELLHAITFDPDGRIENPIPMDDGCATELIAMHVLEHVYAWEAPALVSEWRRLLEPSGRLILELPNLAAACKNMLAGMNDQMVMFPLYGDPSHKDPFMCHRWAFTPATVKALLEANGFAKVKILPPQTHGRRVNRDMRVEAVKA